MSFEFKEQNDFINLDRIYEKALEKQSLDKINMEDFRELYGNRQVDKDLEEVATMKKIFQSRNNPKQINSKKLAVIFEVILGEQSELSNWLGENATTFFASEYDDLKGTDIIVEFSEEEKSSSHLGLAIDATFSSDFGEKFLKIKKGIDDGELSTIKYFSSPSMDFKGRLSQVPRVVIGADNKTLVKLIELWDTNKKQELAKHPIQFQVLEEMKIQLETFEKYALKINQDNLAKKFRIALNIISEIYKKRTEELEDDGRRDGVFDKINSYMELFEN